MVLPEEDPPFRDASLLRVFLLGEIAPEQARRHMVAAAGHADAEVKRLEELRDSIDWTDGDSLFSAVRLWSTAYAATRWKPTGLGGSSANSTGAVRSRKK